MAFFQEISQHQKGRTILDLNEARDDAWQWYQLDHMQVIYTSLQTDNLTTQFLQVRYPSCCPTNSVKALKANREK